MKANSTKWKYYINYSFSFFNDITLEFTHRLVKKVEASSSS